MPESMFGRPSQHLLPSDPPANPNPTPTQPDPQLPLEFKDFRFNSIGKQPGLLSRISLPQLEQTDYQTPTPSPTYTPPPNTQSQSSSRRSLFQQLAGGDPGAMNANLRWHTPTSQPTGSLTSRIQTNLAPPNDVPNIAHLPANGSPIFGRLPGDANLIPPVEVLPQPPDSSPPTPASFAPTIGPTTTRSPTSSLLIHAASAQASRIPSPIPTADTLHSEPTVPLSSFPVTDDGARSLALSATSPIDSLAARHERLQAISNHLANLALPPLLPPHSPSPGPSSIMQTNNNLISPDPNHLQHSASSAEVPDPPSVNRLPSRMGLHVNNTLADADYPASALPQPVVQEFQTQRRVLVEAAQNFTSTLDVLHHVHADVEDALTRQIQTFIEERAAFEQMKRMDVAALQHHSEELQRKHEELNARESNLTLLEKESRAREDARKGMIARRQAQEEEKRAADVKRIQETREQIDIALKEIMEFKGLTERAGRHVGQLASETVPEDLPTEPQEGMDKEEIAALESANNLLRDIKRLRQLHTDGLQKLEESHHTLRRLGDERKKRQAEEAERRRIAQEEHRRMLAEAELARQAQDEKRRQLEAERNRRAAAKEREHAPPHAEASQSAELISQTLQPREAMGSQRPATADIPRVRATHEGNSYSPITHSVDANERVSTLLPDIHISPVRSLKRLASGGVRLSAPIPKLRGGHLPPKPLSGPPSLPSSDRAIENATNLPRPSSAAPLSTESGQKISFPNQLAAEFNRISDVDIRSTPDHRPLSRTSKSQIILDATNGGSQELNIGPVPGVSPTHQNVNLRHLKRSRGRVEENDSGDRSVRSINVKNEETLPPSVKKEEVDDHSRQLAPASSLPPSLPPRPTVIPTPRPWMSKKRQTACQSQTDSISTSPLGSIKNLTDAAPTADERSRARSSHVSQVMNVPEQQPVPPEISNSLLLGPVNSGPQSSETHITTGGRPTQDAEYRGSSSESAAATLSHGLNGEDLPRNNRRFTDEHRRARNGNGPHRMVDRYSPPSVVPRSAALSPTQPHHTTESRGRPNPTNGPRAEPMRAVSPTTSRKRPSEFSDNEHGHRARRQRGDVWIAEEHDRSWVDSYRSERDRRPEPELDDRRTTYRAPPSPDRIWTSSSDVRRTAYDNRTYVPLPPEELTALPPRLEQSYRRPEHDDAYQRYHSPAPSYNVTADQYHRDDTRVGHIYEPMAEERMDTLPDPPLLARMSTSQRIPPPASSHGRGRGELSRGRSRGRGRGNFAPRGRLSLFERLEGPSSMGND